MSIKQTLPEHSAPRRKRSLQPEAAGHVPAQAAPNLQASVLPGDRSLRQATIRQMQQSHGNSFVQRALSTEVQRQDEEQAQVPTPTSTSAPDSATEQQAQTPTPETQSPAAGGGTETTPTQISGVGGTVSTDGGVVRVSGAMVQVDAPMTRVSGVLTTDTLIANTVVGSSYTPGAGNLQ